MFSTALRSAKTDFKLMIAEPTELPTNRFPSDGDGKHLWWVPVRVPTRLKANRFGGSKLELKKSEIHF